MGYRTGNIVCYAVTIWLFAVAGCTDWLAGGLGGGQSRIEKLKPQALRIIREGLQDGDPHIKTKAIEVVAETGLDELMPEVKELLRDGFVPVRFAAALAVGDTQYLPAGAAVGELLRDSDENVRIAAVYALYKLGLSSDLGPVGKALASRDQTVRANAALIMGKLGDGKSLEPLKWAQNDENSDDKVRFQAIESRARLHDETVFKKLWAVLLSVYPDDRVIAIRAMGALGTPKARDVLMTKLDDEVVEVRLAAAEQLGALGSSAGEPQVVEVFEKNLTAGMDNTERERVMTFTALAIGKIGTPELTGYLPVLLQDQSKAVRIAAAEAVFQCSQRR